MVESMFLDALRAAIGTRSDIVCGDDPQAVSLRAMFGASKWVVPGTAGMPLAYTLRDRWIAEGRPLAAQIEDDWLDVQTSIGLVVSLKPEKARNARCRLQVLASREKATRDLRLDSQLINQWFEDHPEPMPETETSSCERARVRRQLDRWLDVKQGERELRALLGD